jgi:murein DD-endopeptidase MepM/ murein hydrolase activator NlpD
MKGQRGSYCSLFLSCSLLLLLLLTACDRDPGECPPIRTASLSEAALYVNDEPHPFRFPLDDASDRGALSMNNFQKSGLETPTRREYHAAEDFYGTPGTPVYALVDGQVSFSGRMGGYGWLVIVDHPQANLYSLYGHLSPSRWQIGKGPVQKGTLLGYLGDDDENGGSAEQPLRPHLHLGLRAGQRADYPGSGEWRWQAGWITPCPGDLGWLQPSVIITGQEIPPGGFENPAGGLLEMWGIELLLAGIYLFGGIVAVTYALKKDKPYNLLAFGGLMLVAAFLLNQRGYKIVPLLSVLVAAMVAIGGFILLRDRRKKAGAQPE